MTMINSTHPGKLLAPIALAITLTYSQMSYAAPDAGQTQRELQQQSVPPATKIEPKLKIETLMDFEKRTEEPKISDMTDVSRFMVRTINISGNNEITTAELQAQVADLVGAERSLAELNGTAARLTAYYRERGYAVARAYLPEQEIRNGEVAIKIIEGHIATYKLDNKSRLSDQRINDYLNRVKPGSSIRTTEIDRTLRLLNDLPGVGGVRATLQPGASVGTSDLAVGIKQGDLLSGNVSLDNYGNRAAGAYLLRGELNINSPLKIGDQITVKALVSDQHLASGQVSYQAPIGNDGLRLGGTYASTRYDLGKEFSILKLHGSASSIAAFATYPFILGQNTNLTGMVNGERKSLTDHFDVTATTHEKQISELSFGLSGNHKDALLGGGNNNASLSLALGKLSIDTPSVLLIDNDSGARTNGNFARLNFSAGRLQRITDNNQLSISLSGQRASKNLDSSEKFSLGGAMGVRAYPQGEGIGDHGYLATLELRQKLLESVQGTLFFDIGSVSINHTPYATTASNTQTLSGAGFGVNTDLAGTQFSAAVAWRTSSEKPTSIPPSAIQTPTFWLQATERF